MKILNVAVILVVGFFCIAFAINAPAVSIYGLFNLLVVSFIGIGFMYIYLRRIGLWCMPFFLFQVMSSLFFIGGYLVVQLRYYFYSPETYNLDVPLKGFIAILISANVSYYSWSYLRRIFPGRTKWGVRSLREINPRFALFAAIGTILLSYFGAYGLFGSLANAPLFSHDIDAARFEMSINRSRGYYWFFLFCGYHSVTLLFAAIVNVRRNIVRDIVLGIVIVIAVFPLILYGGRSFVIVPLLVCAILFARARSMKFRTVAVFGFILLIMIQLFGVFRSHDRTITISNYIHSVYTEIFPEVRTLAQTHYMMRAGGRSSPKYLYSFVSAIFPKVVFSSIGLNKDNYNRGIGSYISSFDPNSRRGQGYRVTLLGEIMLFHGPIGVVVWGIVLGMVFMLLDSMCLQQVKGVNLYNYAVSYFIVLPMVTVPYGTTYFSTIVWLYMQLFIVVKVLGLVESSGRSVVSQR